MLLTAHTDKKNKKTDYGRKVSVAAGGRAGKKKTATSPQARNPKIRSRGTMVPCLGGRTLYGKAAM